MCKYQLLPGKRLTKIDETALEFTENLSTLDCQMVLDHNSKPENLIARTILENLGLEIAKKLTFESKCQFLKDREIVLNHVIADLSQKPYRQYFNIKKAV